MPAVQRTVDFETAMVHVTRSHDASGIVCAHVEIGQSGDCLYANWGDWVKCCTTLEERSNGTFELLHCVDSKLNEAIRRHLAGDGQAGRFSATVRRPECCLQVN